MRKVKTDASALLFALILILLAGGIVFAVFSLRSDPVQKALAENRAINTLFVIENPASSGGETKPLGTYVLMYYPATKRAAVIDVPGALGFIIQYTNRFDRLDSIYDPRKIAPYESEIEKFLEMDISFSVVITFENLGKITDLIEGVELFIPSQVEEYQESHILFPSGVTGLDGDKARVYISYELPEESSELANFRRQRFFMGFIKRLGERNQFLNDPRVSALFHSLLKTGLDRRTLMKLFNEFAGINMDRVSIQSVGGNIREVPEVSEKQVLYPLLNGSLIKDIVRQTLGSLVQPADSSGDGRTFTVEVLNGTAVNGLAGRTAELLRGFGYDIISIANADRNDYEKTLIIDRSGLEGMAKDFGAVIRCDNFRFDTQDLANPEIDLILQNFEYKADFTIVIGKDFDGRYVAR